MTTFDKVKDIIVDSLSCDEEQVTLEASLKDDLDADSLDAVELIMAVEDEFDVQIPDEEANGIRNVPGTQHPDALVNCFERYITKLRDTARNK